jgi:serine phosphatase RsbU (regulator of sigma subunit)/CHASE3 domain sensor protein
MGAVSLRTRVAAAAIAGVVAIVVIAAVVWSAFASADRVGTAVTQRLSPAAASASDLVVAYDDVDRESRSFVVTGSPSARARYAAARARATAQEASLGRDLATYPDLLADVAAVREAADAWLGRVVEPAVAAREHGPLRPGEVLAFLDTSSSAYVPVARATHTLDDEVSAARDEASDELGTLARRLAAALALSGLALLALVLAAYLLLRRWVLRPLDDLRGQLREVAREGQHHHVIEPDGPPELYAAGADAEAMRQALVRGEDAARAADEGLEQEGPVVSALRADLATDPDPTATRLAVHGRMQAAHGVLAGDWWGVVRLDGERSALVVLDVSGHGELAGLVTQRLRSVLTVSLRSGFDAATALERGATSFVDSDDGRFATALVVVLDPAGGALEWANAGHPAGWLLPGGDPRRRTVLSATGPMLSALGGRWTSGQAEFSVGDVVLAWSDGLVEAADAGRDLPDEAFAAVVAAVHGSGPHDLVEGILAALRERSADWRRDDVTLVAARRTT